MRKSLSRGERVRIKTPWGSGAVSMDWKFCSISSADRSCSGIPAFKDTTAPLEMRLDAAKAAIRFEKPALSSVDQKGDTAPRYIAYLPQACVIRCKPATDSDAIQASTTPEEWLRQHGQGQVRELLDILTGPASFEGFALRPTMASYS